MKSNKFFDNDPVIINSKADSNFRVIKNLVKAENNLNLIQNRVKVLQLNENKNHSKLQNQIQLIEKIMKVRNNHAEDVEKLKTKIEDRQLIQATLKHRNLELNKNHKSKIEEISEQLKSIKKANYEKIQEDKQLAQSQIRQSKQKQLKEKQKKRLMIVQTQDSARQNIIKYHEQKSQKIGQDNRKQIEKILRKQKQKENQLTKIAQIQMEMIQKQSSSQAAYMEIKQKLDSLLSNVKKENSECKKLLKPSIHLQKSTERIRF